MSRSESTFDAIVVGSGARTWAVKELTEGGLKIVRSRPGRNLDLARDFPADATVGAVGMVGRAKRPFKASRFKHKCGSFLREHQTVLCQRHKKSLHDAARKTVPLVQGTATRWPPSHVVETCTPHVEFRVQSREPAWMRRRLAALI